MSVNHSFQRLPREQLTNLHGGCRWHCTGGVDVDGAAMHSRWLRLWWSWWWSLRKWESETVVVSCQR